jgi:hypothetical protein
MRTRLKRMEKGTRFTRPAAIHHPRARNRAAVSAVHPAAVVHIMGQKPSAAPLYASRGLNFWQYSYASLTTGHGKGDESVSSPLSGDTDTTVDSQRWDLPRICRRQSKQARQHTRHNCTRGHLRSGNKRTATATTNVAATSTARAIAVATFILCHLTCARTANDHSHAHSQRGSLRPPCKRRCDTRSPFVHPFPFPTPTHFSAR